MQKCRESAKNQLENKAEKSRNYAVNCTQSFVKEMFLMRGEGKQGDVNPASKLTR